jgi:hypothetical protein
MTMTSTTASVPSTRPAPAAPAPARPDGWTGGRVLGVVLGSLLVLAGLGVLAGGGIAAGAASERDHAGYFVTGTERFSAHGFAVATDALDMGDDAETVTPGDLVELRLRATPAGASSAVFLGIGRTADVEAYLAGVPHRVVRDFDTGRAGVDYRTVAGASVPSNPGAQDFWAVSSTGTGRQAVTWEPDGGDWTAVLMNADGSPGVTANVDAGVSIEHLWVFIGGLLGAGVVLTAGGTVAIVAAVRRATR